MIRNVPTWLLLFPLALLPLVSYFSTLDNYYLLADFFQIGYVHHALKQPLSIFRDFTDSWLGARSFELFYRPLPVLLLAFNMLTTGANPIGHHVTSLILHICCVFAVFFFTREFLRWTEFFETDPSTTQPVSRVTAVSFFAAAFFSVNALNAESVVWISARPDCGAALFSMLSLYLWVRQLRTNDRNLTLLYMVSYLVALFFKETAATVPFIAFILHFVKPASFKERVLSSLRATWKFFAVFAFYLFMRFMALGTIIGGYHSSFWSVMDSEDYLGRWMHPDFLLKFPFPLNSNLDSSATIQTILAVTYLIGVLVALSDQKALKASAKVSGTCLLWLALCMIPVYKMSCLLTASLLNGRAFYFPTIPFSIALATILLSPWTTRWKRIASSVVASVVLACFFWADYSNNSIWNHASDVSRKVQEQLTQFIAKTPADQKVLFLNPPYYVRGIYVINGPLLPAMVSPPFTSETLVPRIVLVDPFHAVDCDLNLINATGLRMELLQSCVLAKWNPDTLTLAMHPMEPDLVAMEHHYFDIKELNTKFPNIKRFEIESTPSIRPLSNDAIEVRVQCQNDGSPAKLAFNWRDKPEGEIDFYDRDLETTLRADGKPHAYRFDLAEQIGWFLKPEVIKMHITLKNPGQVQSVSAKLVGNAKYIPSLRPDYGCFTRNYAGELVALPSGPSFICDSEVPGTKGLAVELSRPDELFETYTKTFRDTKFSVHAGFRQIVKGPTSHEFHIPPTALKKPGFYSARTAAIDGAGQIIGAFSDPVVFRWAPISEEGR